VNIPIQQFLGWVIVLLFEENHHPIGEAVKVADSGSLGCVIDILRKGYLAAEITIGWG